MSESSVVIEETTDPELIAKSQRHEDIFRRNMSVFDAHDSELFAGHRGKVVVVADQELHVADDADAAWDWVGFAHPAAVGVFIQSIPREKGWRIYADSR